MLIAVARFEMRYLLRNPLIWATALLTFSAFAAATSVDGFELGSEGGLLRNASYAVMRNMMLLSVMYMVVLAAFVANAIVRDHETGYGPIMWSTPTTPRALLLGRFFGALVVVAMCLLLGALGLLTGTALPWANPAELGPNAVAPYAFSVLVVALPNLFIGGVVLFCLAAATRSMMGTYLGVIGFGSAFFFIEAALGDLPDLRAVLSLVDPFGVRAISDASRYWTVAQRNVLLPEVSGLLLTNRLLWVAVASALLALTVWRYRAADASLSRRTTWWRRMGLRLADQPREHQPAAHAEARSLPGPQHNAAGLRTLLWLRTRFESWQIISSPVFPVLLAWGLFTTLVSLTIQRDPDGSPTYPTTLSLIPEIAEGLAVMPLLVAVYFAGDLVWRERDRRMHELVDSSPMPNWAYVVPKTIAMLLILASISVIGVLSAVIVQLSLGFHTIEIGKYLLWFVLPTTWDMTLLAAAAVTIHALSPHKVIGWGVLLLLVLVQQVFQVVDHNLLVYGGHPSVPLSDLAQAGSFWIGGWTYRVYWGAFAVLLLMLAHVFWPRGADVRFGPRLAGARQALRGAPGKVAVVAAVFWAVAGSTAYYNTNVLAGYRSDDEMVAEAVAYERRYAQYFEAPQPEIVHLAMNVALFPVERRAEVSGRYRLRNRTESPIHDVHIRVLDQQVELLEATLTDAQLLEEDPIHRHRIFRLRQAMMPGEERELVFRARRHVRGFRNSWPETQLIENGSFLNETQLGPVVGLFGAGLLDDPELRREHGLPEQAGPPRLGDSTAQRRPSNLRGWATADVTVSTSADQTPLAAGNKVLDVTAGGRRTARFVSTVPTRARFVVLSARYAERHREHHGVKLSVYHHPTHAWNVERMLESAAQSLDYYQANFGPYQFDHFRIVELPGYYGFAQAFGGTIPFSETVGFIADYTQPETIDQVAGMTAHELAHQWWAYQVAAANMEGEGVLSETMAQYAAHMVVKHTRGEAHIRRYLRFELDRYLANRKDQDQPLARATGQHHLLYRKGALAMYLLQQRMGEESVNRALRALVSRFRFQDAPYATTNDLLAALRAEARTAEHQALITDLFERVTLYDLRVDAPQATQRSDGQWQVTVPVIARKWYVDSTGAESEAALDESIEIGLFTEEPGSDAFSAAQVITMERRPLRSGRQVLNFVTATRPSHAGVDPYNAYIDRRSEDNVRPVK